MLVSSSNNSLARHWLYSHCNSLPSHSCSCCRRCCCHCHLLLLLLLLASHWLYPHLNFLPSLCQLFHVSSYIFAILSFSTLSQVSRPMLCNGDIWRYHILEKQIKSPCSPSGCQWLTPTSSCKAPPAPPATGKATNESLVTSETLSLILMVIAIAQQQWGSSFSCLPLMW